MKLSPDADVLIVGAGPVGAAAALAIAAEGASVRLVDQSVGVYPLPRAAHIDHETVRILQGLGVADAVMRVSKPVSRYDFLTADRRLLMRFGRDGERGSPSGWPPSNMIHQPSVEAALRAQIASTPAIRVDEGWRLADFDDHGDGVEARFETAGGPRTCSAQWLVGCDGARSRVRDIIRAGIDDLGFDEPWLVVDVIVRDASRLPDANLQICDPARPTTCVHMGSGRHRWEFMLLPGETEDEMQQPERVTELLEPWNVGGAVEIERTAVYRFHALVARRWRVGRAILAGDSAHQTPPFAGQGLCSGVRDAANLAWKLGAVLRGAAPAALLDTYQSEREPHVRALIGLAVMMGRTVCVTDPAAAAARDAAWLAGSAAPAPAPGPEPGPGCFAPGAPGSRRLFPQPVAETPDGTVRLDDRLGPGPWLIARRLPNGERGPDGLARYGLDAPRLAPFRDALSAWFDDHAADAVLVRPDRYVFGEGDASVLEAAWARALAT